MSKDEEVSNLTSQLENTQLEIVEYVTKVATLEEKMKSNGGSSSVASSAAASVAASLEPLPGIVRSWLLN